MGKTSALVKRRYNAKAYDRIELAVKKGEKERIRRYAEEHGESVNGFICNLIQRELAGFEYTPEETEE